MGKTESPVIREEETLDGSRAGLGRALSADATDRSRNRLEGRETDEVSDAARRLAALDINRN